MRQRGTRAEEDALNVDPVQALEVLRGRLLDCADVGDAGVVHEDVDPGMDRLDAVEDRSDVRRIRDVALKRAAVSAVLRERLDRRAGLGLVEIEGDHVGTTPREDRRDRRSDARTRTGHNGDLPLQIEHLRAGTMAQAAATRQRTLRLLYR